MMSDLQKQMRLASASALGDVPRDPRFYKPDRERQWTDSNPLYSHYIPSYELDGDEGITCFGQIEPFVRRPTSKPNADFVLKRMSMGRRTSPLISPDSIGWNRRNYEPVPDIARARPFVANNYRPPTPSAMMHQSSGLSRSSFGGSRYDPPTYASVFSHEYASGYNSAVGSTIDGLRGGTEPPRIEGVDTAARPPLVVHSPSKVRRHAWIGTRY